MHSNGGRGLAAVAAVGESRRVKCSAALVHRRSFGGTGVIAGATGEKLRIVSTIGFSALGCSFAAVTSCRWRPAQSERSKTLPVRVQNLVDALRVHLQNMSESPNENHMSIAFPVEGNSGMNSGNLLEPTADAPR
jgi:hypothetical protein